MITISPSIISKLAIIPAKAYSERCPGKNMRLLAGSPLFLHSVAYAVQEGFTPLVSTDSEEVMAICKYENIRCVREIVDDRRMENCVRQALACFSCKQFAVLQPTSPFRTPGLLKRMGSDLEAGIVQSGYTYQKIKIIGHMDGQFQLARREQDARRFLYFFDGNINVISQDQFLRTGTFFDNESRPYPNVFPCCLQIDTEEEWNVMTELSKSPNFHHFLAPGGRRKRVCIISNKRDLQRNYSLFINSCDIVMRISKMDNIHSGLVGTKTDIALVSCFSGYLAFSPKERHMEELLHVPVVYFNNEELGCSHEFACREGLKNWKFLPSAVHRSTTKFTTLSKGLCLADYLFPDAQLYFLGDTDMSLRAPGSPKHHAPTENAYMQSLIESGRLIPILEDDAETFNYSSPATFEERHANTCLQEEDTVKRVMISHPLWTDQFLVGTRRGHRLHRNDHADILKDDDFSLVLRWDNWGTEEFVKISEGCYRLVEYRYDSSINDVSKYTTELVINPYDGDNSIFRHWKRPFIGMQYCQWDFMLLLDRMLLDISQEMKRMPRLQSVLLVGICKDALASLILSVRLKKLFPELNIGVWGCPWIGDFSGDTLAYHGIILSPAHERIRTLEPYRSLLKLNGDPKCIMQQNENSGVQLFAFYSTNKTWPVDEEATKRLEPWLRRTYAHRGSNDEPHTHIHGKIIHLLKQNPEQIGRWVDEMFLSLREKSPVVESTHEKHGLP